jgi:hypothetical protein
MMSDILMVYMINSILFGIFHIIIFTLFTTNIKQYFKFIKSQHFIIKTIYYSLALPWIIVLIIKNYVKYIFKEVD